VLPYYGPASRPEKQRARSTPKLLRTIRTSIQ